MGEVSSGAMKQGTKIIGKVPEGQKYSIEQNELGFYSQLERALANPKVQATQRASDWQKFLSGSKVKKEEIETIGLDKFLKARAEGWRDQEAQAAGGKEGDGEPLSEANKKVTKAQIQNYISKNELQLEEVEHGEPSTKEVEKARAPIKAKLEKARAKVTEDSKPIIDALVKAGETEDDALRLIRHAGDTDSWYADR